jgi:hypothetical protein
VVLFTDIWSALDPWNIFGPILSRAPFLYDDDRVSALLGGTFVDIKERFDPSIRDLLRTGDWSLLPSFEQGSVLAQAGASTVGVLVPRMGSGFAHPIRIGVDGAVLKATSVPVVDPEGRSLAVLTDQGRAVYSAIEDAAYFIGGAEGSVFASLRRYSLADGSTTVFEGIEAVEGEVAGIAVHPRQRLVYVLFIDRGDVDAQARIAWIDMSDGSSGALLQVPYSAANRRLALGLGPDGEMMIFADGPSGVEGWMYDIVGGSAVFVGSLATSGTLLDVPHPALSSVVTLHNEGPKVDWLERTDFTLANPLTQL